MLDSTRKPTASSAMAWVYTLGPVKARLLLLGFAGFLALGLGFIFDDSFNMLEERAGALGWTLNPSTLPEERISIVAIDEKSLAEVGPYPWPRETMARLTQALSDAGVQLQLYDIVFPEPSAGDAVFAAALENTAAVLAQVPIPVADPAVETGVMTHPVAGLSCNADTVNAQSYIANVPAFASVAKGHIAPNVDADGAVRSQPAYICVDGEPYPSLALSALLMATSIQPWSASVSAGESLFEPAQLLRLDAYPGLAIPLDGNGNMRVSFKNAPETYRQFSAVDVLEGRIDRTLLENTWVLVGYTAFGLPADIVPTPYAGAAPGVEIQARILGSLLDDAIPYTPRGASLLLTVLSVAFAGVLLSLASARERLVAYGLPAATLMLPFVAFLLHVQMLAEMNVVLGWVNPALYGVVAGVLLVLHEHGRVRIERSRVMHNLSSYLPTDVAQEIAYTLPNSSINARRQDVTLLSADLRNFSAYGESRPPEESAALLHYFFVRTTDIIEKHNGRVHEFKGDSLLAIWDGNASASAAAALAAAQEMQRAIQDVLPQTPPEGLEPLALGIGIEQGPVLIGSIGPAHRRSHTLLGETVTITLRIQEMTADLAHPILIGESAARQLSGSGLQSQGSYLLNGLRIPHTLFAPPLQDAPMLKEKSNNPSLKLLHGGRK